MRRNQQGATAAGFIIMALIVGMIAFGGIRVIPIYLEHMKVSTLLQDVKEDLDGTKPSAALIRSALNKRINVEMIRDLDARQFKITKTKVGTLSISVSYERRERYLGNVYLVVVFDESVEIQP